MAVNKVVMGDTVLIDLSNDTAGAANIMSGITAHNKSGESITGTMVIQSYYSGYVDPSDDLGNDGDLYFQMQEG